jgi:hypothetical protein
VTGIVAADPRWQTIIGAWRATPKPWTASLWLGTQGFAAGMPVGAPTVEPGAAPPGGLEASAVDSAPTAGPRRAPMPTPPANPARAGDSKRSVDQTPSAQADTTHVMASILVTELGLDPALRAALTNAEAHTPGSPEFTFWHQVATAILDRGARPRL